LRVYTSLDLVLQKAAVEAVQNGLKLVQQQVAAQRKRDKNAENLPGPQAALIALDPHTGEIKAMVGGSDYGASQYNRITQASRQPGSISNRSFKQQHSKRQLMNTSWKQRQPPPILTRRRP